MARTGEIQALGDRFVRFESELHRKLLVWSIPALRITVGAIFLAFGVLKFFPDVSPAQDLATATFDKLSIGLIPAQASIYLIGSLECFIGICMLSGRFMRLAIWLLVIQLIGILSPLALLSDRLFAGPGGAPTLEGQYVIKDIVLVAAAMAIAAGTFRSGRMVREEPDPTSAAGGNRSASPDPRAERAEDEAREAVLA